MRSPSITCGARRSISSTTRCGAPALPWTARARKATATNMAKAVALAAAHAPAITSSGGFEKRPNARFGLFLLFRCLTSAQVRDHRAEKAKQAQAEDQQPSGNACG